MREELAKSFYAAYLANQMGISYQTAYKNYTKERVGELWLALADAAIKGVKAHQAVPVSKAAGA